MVEVEEIKDEEEIKEIPMRVYKQYEVTRMNNRVNNRRYRRSKYDRMSIYDLPSIKIKIPESLGVIIASKESCSQRFPFIDESIMYDNIEFRGALLDEIYVLDKYLYVYRLSRRKVKIGAYATIGYVPVIDVMECSKCKSNQVKYLERMIICDDCKEVLDTIEKIEY